MAPKWSISRAGGVEGPLGAASGDPATYRFLEAPYYTTIMEVGSPRNHNEDDLFLEPNSIMVVYMEPLGFLKVIP